MVSDNNRGTGLSYCLTIEVQFYDDTFTQRRSDTVDLCSL